MAFGGNPTVLGSGLPIATGGVSVVSGPASSTDNAIVRWNGTGGNLVQNSVNILSDNGDLSLPSTATLGLQLYNTADQTTNVQRLEALYGSSVAQMGTRTVGTAASTPLHIFSQGTNASGSYARADVVGSGTPPFFRQGVFSTATGTTNISFSGTGTFVSFGNITSTATSGTIAQFAITPTYNQASGTAANTDLLINRTETAVGSGNQRLLDLQVGGVSRFLVDNNGNAVLTTLFSAARVQATASVGITSKSRLTSASDGVMMVSNNGETDFTRLQFGGTAATNGAIGTISVANGWGLALPSAADTNGQKMRLEQLTELTTIAAAATTDTTIQIPANAIVYAVSVRVTTVIPTATTFDVGIAGATTRYGTGISSAATTTNAGTNDATRFYSGATAIRITPDATPGDNTGRVRVTIHYIAVTPPTS